MRSIREKVEQLMVGWFTNKAIKHCSLVMPSQLGHFRETPFVLGHHLLSDNKMNVNSKFNKKLHQVLQVLDFEPRLI